MKWAILVVLVSVRASVGWTLIDENVLGWNTQTLSIHVNPTNCTISEADLYDVIDRSIALWNSIPTSHLKVVRDSTPSESTVVDFLAGTASDAPLVLCDPNFATSNNVDANVIPAATRMAKDTNNNLAYGGILLNAQPAASAEIAALTATELSITVAHELGHVLGLGHSSTKEALMYYSIADKPDAVITQDDMEGFAYLYPRNEFRSGLLGCGSVHQRESSASGFCWFLLMTMMMCFAVRPARLRGFRG